MTGFFCARETGLVKPLDDRMRRIRPLTMRFSPGRGVLVDALPPETVIDAQSLEQARQRGGVFMVQGRGGIGSRLTVTAANGEAVYEITGRCVLADGKSSPAWIATRRNWKLKLAGKPVDVRTYDLNTITKLFGEWPLAAALKADVLEPPQKWRPQVAWLKDVVTFAADGETATYRVFGRHPGYDREAVHLIERITLQSKDLTQVTMPPAYLAGSATM